MDEIEIGPSFHLLHRFVLTLPSLSFQIRRSSRTAPCWTPPPSPRSPLHTPPRPLSPSSLTEPSPPLPSCPVSPTVVHRKLTLLTLASLAATADTLPYDVVARHLYLVGDDLDHAVEDAVVAAMDAGLLMARLDAAGRRVLVLSATPREVDPDPAHVARLADSLDGWRKFVVGVADQLDVMVQEQL